MCGLHSEGRQILKEGMRDSPCSWTEVIMVKMEIFPTLMSRRSAIPVSADRVF